MRILALETSERAGSLAALDDDRLLAQCELAPAQRSAQSLAPALKSLWQAAAWQPADVEMVAVTVGPGSFTGLRVGVTTAKVLAYAVGAEIFGVDTLETIAQQAPPEICRVSAAVDAQRGQVIAQNFARDEAGVFQPLAAACLIDVDRWLATLPEGFAASGPILRKLPAQAPAGIRLVEAELWTPQAATVGRIALRRHRAGERHDLWQLLPRYSRRAAAEEKWDALGKP